jgi:hypothetical protein
MFNDLKLNISVIWFVFLSNIPARAIAPNWNTIITTT